MYDTFLRSASLRLFLATLAKLLFPSWAFFDVAGATPLLEVRRCHLTQGPDSASRDVQRDDSWIAALRAPTRRWWHVVFNPEGTRVLAAQSLVERWVREREEDGENSDNARRSQTLIANLAECSRPSAWRTGASSGWQWRITLRGAQGVDVVHVSEPMP